MGVVKYELYAFESLSTSISVCVCLHVGFKKGVFFM